MSSELIATVLADDSPEASPEQKESDRYDLFKVLAIFIVATILLFLVASWFRKRASQQQAVAKPMGFSLSDLRRMRDAGQITEQEFAKAKEKVVQKVKEEAQEPKPLEPLE